MTALAKQLPRRTPIGDQRPGHIEIVTSREQRRSRPRLVAAIITVAGLFAILAAQLLLTIATSEGAYEIAGLQSKQAELARDEQVLAEGIRVLDAPQHLAAEAQGMGMVPNSGAAQLRLSDAVVLGAPMAATATSTIMTAADGSPLIPNSLLADVPLVGADEMARDAAGASEDPAAGAPDPASADASVPSTPVGIPTPTTH